jgi:hypothetical protein
VSPTFLGNAVPLAAADAADACTELPEEFDLITRRLSITDDPSEAVFHSWDHAIQTIAAGWVLVDDSTRQAIERGVRKVLQETVDTPSAGDRLLESLVPPRGRLAEPLDVWRGAWQAGMLGVIGAGVGLPPSVAEQARRQLDVGLGDRALDAVDFGTGADAWLALAVPDLVDATETDVRAFDFWEMWLAAQRRLGDPDRIDAALMHAVARFLATSTDLAQAGPSTRVVGRLLTVADFEESPVVKDAVRELFDDADAVADHDLWVLTSLLAQLDTAPWFTAELVLPDQAGAPFRNRLRDRIAAAWPTVRSVLDEVPETQARGLQVELRSAMRWLELLGRAPDALDPAEPEELMHRLLTAARLNLVASMLAARQRAEAETMMDELERRVDDADAPIFPGGPTGGAPARGQAAGRDGEWAGEYTVVRRNTEERLRLLRSLRTRAATDLGPIDSELFVREVYRGSPQEVRALARGIIADQFALGPNVAIELLDQFVDAPETEGVSEVITRLTGRLLPQARSESWAREARLALVRHALDLHPAGATKVDLLALALRDAYVERSEMVGQAPSAGTPILTPLDALRLLTGVWGDRAAMTIAVAPAPDDLPGLGRRRATRQRLARGPLQTTVAEQLALLDFFTYVTVAERPDQREEALTLLALSSERRGRAEHVLQQAIEAEYALARMWALRFGIAGPGGEAP